MRIFIITFLFFKLLFSDSLQNESLITLFKKNYFTYICQNRWRYINKYLGKREDLLSIVAFSCLKKHKLTLALDVAKALRFTKLGRINSSYIVSLFAIKSYLIRYIEDNFDVKSIKLPIIRGDDLGKVFLIVQKTLPKVKDNKFFVKLGSNLVEVDYSIKTNEIALKFFDKSNNLIRKEIYW